jgi:solute:Na+ symporter, SSS family
VTVIVSYMTAPRPEKELAGLVYGETAIPYEGDMSLLERPVFWAGVVSVVFVILNLLFW